MVARKFIVSHNDSDFHVDYDTDDGFEIIGGDGDRAVSDDSDLITISEKLLLVSLSEEGEEKLGNSGATCSSGIAQSDEELARMLQAEEEALMFQQYIASDNGAEMKRKIRPYVEQVLMYEDPKRQEAARKTVPVLELEEKALVSLAKIWASIAPLKLCFFVWEATWGMILVIDQLITTRVVIIFKRVIIFSSHMGKAHASSSLTPNPLSCGLIGQRVGSLEVCCKWRGKKLFKGDVNDRGRRFRIEMRQNEAEHYLLISVLSEDDRRYFIIIPKGFDLLGWDFMRRKLRELAKIGDATKSKAKKRSEEVWVEVGNEAYTSKLKDLSQFLVGRWDIEDEVAPDLRVVEIWANSHWSVYGQVSVVALRGSLFLFEFSTASAAQKVLEEGIRFLNGVRLSLDWWAPTVGCSRMEFQRDVGDACGGFVVVDEETKEPCYRKGTRILVKNNGKEVPGSLEGIAEFASFSILLWKKGGAHHVLWCASRAMVRVERELCGEGTLAAGVGVRVNGLELRIPEEKARQKDYEGLVSPQEEASLVKETSDVTKVGCLNLPNRKKGLKKGLAQASLLGLHFSESGEFKSEIPKPVSVGEISELEASPLDQCLSRSLLKSYLLGSLRGHLKNPLEPELPLCMVLKDGCSFTLPGNDGASRLEGGDEAVTLRSRDNEVPMLHDFPVSSKEDTPHLHITVVGEVEKDKSPWVNKKFLWFCKSMRVSIEGFKEDILRILKEIENRRCFISKPNESKRGTLSASRKDRELNKLVNTINYDGLAGRVAEEGELGRQIVVVPYEA
ncbi:Peptide-N(4)-(N-acetyl-beta-glucosaminyl)asparagine amidase [Vitis vinifera]|uniref:Peptide-N(4)-(N-acetyl-beta-glucosaminyl)asparagine amidase n=1 Tax=Vitis vinifera TaxID=29760 RepID=A0A438DRI1_VITVI|nr:Peptide-N(4)-(N-acetyl-beta-glucosaminyl)asparagine amidase [Vitis vinifera]